MSEDFVSEAQRLAMKADDELDDCMPPVDDDADDDAIDPDADPLCDLRLGLYERSWRQPQQRDHLRRDHAGSGRGRDALDQGTPDCARCRRSHGDARWPLIWTGTATDENDEHDRLHRRRRRHRRV